MTQQIKRFGQIVMDKRKKQREFLALQRNLCALNTAFETARAGKVGAEFFVAVEEARNLAIQGTNSTSDKNERD